MCGVVLFATFRIWTFYICLYWLDLILHNVAVFLKMYIEYCDKVLFRDCQAE